MFAANQGQQQQTCLCATLHEATLEDSTGRLQSRCH